MMTPIKKKILKEDGGHEELEWKDIWEKKEDEKWDRRMSELETIAFPELRPWRSDLDRASAETSQSTLWHDFAIPVS